MSIGAILQISSYSVAQMIVGRIVAGLGNGLNTATAPVWQAETSKAYVFCLRAAILPQTSNTNSAIVIQRVERQTRGH